MIALYIASLGIPTIAIISSSPVPNNLWISASLVSFQLSILACVIPFSSAITRAFKTQRKAKKLNLSYANYDEALEDLLSEVKELEEAEQLEDRKREIGDVIFSIINVCRYLEADPEIQLNKSTQRFIERAQYVEKHIKEDSNLEKLWQEAKKTEEK